MTDPDHLIIVGAGGFGLEVASYAEDIIRMRGVGFSIAGFLDDTKPRGTTHGTYPVLGNTEGELAPDALYVIALGRPQPRRAMVEKLRGRGAKFATLMHPAAYISSTAIIGLGSIIAPFASIGPQAILGAQVVINTHASIAHDAQVGDCSVVAQHAALDGFAELDANVFIGMHAVIGSRCKIAADSVVAAGAHETAVAEAAA